jgi:hypothetical protein
MSKGRKKLYRLLAWFFSVVVATGALVGCASKYGPPPDGAKYGPPPASGYNNTIQKDAVEKDV